MHCEVLTNGNRSYTGSGTITGIRVTVEQVSSLFQEITKGEDGWDKLVAVWPHDGRSRPLTESEFCSYPWAGQAIYRATLKASKGSLEATVHVDHTTNIEVAGPDEDWVLSTRERLLDSLRMCQPDITRWAVRVRPVLIGLSCMLAILMVLELLRPDLLAAGLAGLSALVSAFMCWYLGYATRSCIVFRQPDRAALRDHIRLVIMAAALLVSLLTYWGA